MCTTINISSLAPYFSKIKSEDQEVNLVPKPNLPSAWRTHLATNKCLILCTIYPYVQSIYLCISFTFLVMRLYMKAGINSIKFGRRSRRTCTHVTNVARCCLSARCYFVYFCKYPWTKIYCDRHDLGRKASTLSINNQNVNVLHNSFYLHVVT